MLNKAYSLWDSIIMVVLCLRIDKLIKVIINKNYFSWSPLSLDEVISADYKIGCMISWDII